MMDHRHYVFCPSRQGHIFLLAKRLAEMVFPQAFRLVCNPDEIAPSCQHLLIVGTRNEQELVTRLIRERPDRVTLFAPHAWPHVCGSARRNAIEALFQLCDEVLTPTQEVALDLRANHAVTQSVALVGYPCVVTPKKRPPSGHLRLLMAGYLGDHKGVNRLAPLLNALDQQGSAACLALVGQVDQRLICNQTAAKLRIIDGYATERSLTRWRRWADVMLICHDQMIDTPQIPLAAEIGLPSLCTQEVRSWAGDRCIGGASLAWEANHWADAVVSLARNPQIQGLCLDWSLQQRQTLAAQLESIFPRKAPPIAPNIHEAA